MPRHIITFGAVTTLLAACSGPTDPNAREVNFKPNFSQTEPGTPGDPNCRGQSMAFLAQFGKTSGGDFRGIGGFARAADLTVQEVRALVDAFCADV